MMQVTVTHELDDLRRKLVAMREQQIPYATARALTATAKAAQVDTVREMQRVFDRPTPFVLSGVRTRPATKANLTAEVLLKDDAAKSVPLAKALAHQVTGGPRWWKRSEGSLRRIGLLGNDENAVPGGAATMDSYGNMSRGQIVQILAYFQAFGQQGYKANTTQARREKLAAGKAGRKYGVRFYYKRDRPGRGIYVATQTGFGSAIKPVLMFVRRAQYRKRLDMLAVVDRTKREQFSRLFEDAMRQAMATATAR